MKSFLLVAFLVFAFCGVDAQKAGTLDSSFGENGKVINPTELYSPDASILLNDGKILSCGNSYVARYLANGAPDTSFGVNGLANLFPYGVMHGISINTDGKIIVNGYAKGKRGSDIAIIRLKSDGKYDSTFGSNGASIIDFAYTEYSIDNYTLPDGKIIVVGYTDNTELGKRGLIFRCLPNGKLDKTFGQNGKADFSDLSPSYYNKIEVQPDGKIVTAGYAGISDKIGLVVRYTSEGLMDSTFGKKGFATTAESGSQEIFNSLKLQTDGKIVTGGTTYNQHNTDGKILAARYNVDGSLDKTFGKAGYTIVKFENDADGNDIVIQNNGKIVVAGSAYIFPTPEFDFGLCRLTADGVIDSAFGKNGLQVTDFGESDVCQNLLLQEDGKLIAIGYRSAENPAVIFARYYGEPVKQQTPIVKKIKRWIRNHTLNWQYNADVDYFVIEQSSNGVNGYKGVAKVKAVNRQSLNVNEVYTYNLNDFAYAQLLNANSKTYYRITAVSNNSKVVSTVISDEDVISITISPNPVKDVMKISGLPANQKTTINIVNRNGNILQFAVCNSSVYMMNVAPLKSGLYNVQVICKGKTQMLKFVKE